MPYYENSSYLKRKIDEEFEKYNLVSTPAPVSGIYRCTLCGHEIVIDKNRKLPPDGNHGLDIKSKDHYGDAACKKPLSFKWELVAAPIHRDGGINRMDHAA